MLYELSLRELLCQERYILGSYVTNGLPTAGISNIESILCRCAWSKKIVNFKPRSLIMNKIC